MAISNKVKSEIATEFLNTMNGEAPSVEMMRSMAMGFVDKCGIENLADLVNFLEEIVNSMEPGNPKGMLEEIAKNEIDRNETLDPNARLVDGDLVKYYMQQIYDVVHSDNTHNTKLIELYKISLLVEDGDYPAQREYISNVINAYVQIKDLADLPINNINVDTLPEQFSIKNRCPESTVIELLHHIGELFISPEYSREWYPVSISNLAEQLNKYEGKWATMAFRVSLDGLPQYASAGDKVIFVLNDQVVDGTLLKDVDGNEFVLNDNVLYTPSKVFKDTEYNRRALQETI